MKLNTLGRSPGLPFGGSGEIEDHRRRPPWNKPPGHITFLANPKYAAKPGAPAPAAILVAEPLAGGRRSLVCFRPNPYLDFARALALFYQPPRPAPGIHPLASVAAASAVIGRETPPSARFAVVGERCEDRPQTPSCNTARREFMRASRSATISSPIRTPPCVNSCDRAPRDPAERRRNRRRRLWFRQARRRHPCQDRPIRRHRSSKTTSKCRASRRSIAPRLAETRVRRGAKDRQPGADRPRLRGG